MTGIFFPKTPTVVKIISTWNFSLKMIFFCGKESPTFCFFYIYKKLPFFEEVAKMEFNFGGVSLISSLYIKENNFVKKVWKLVQIIKKNFFFITFCKGQANFECDRGD